MFIRFFKSNNASAFVFLPIVAIALWVFGFNPPVLLTGNHFMPLYELFAGALFKVPYLSTCFAFILIIFEAFLLNLL